MISTEFTVEKTPNEKYQKGNAKGEPIYHVGFQGHPELVGKKIRVVVEILDD